MIEINSQREKYINARGKVILNACPGSGKTTIISYKLHQLIENDYCNSNFGIVCLSFTNVAKDEINDKFSEFSKKTLRYPHLVSTIDSFINSYITLPFYYLLYLEIKRPQILDDNDYLNQSFGLQNALKNRGGFKHLTKDNKPLYYNYPPSGIIKDIQGNYTINGTIPNADKVDTSIFNEYAKTIKNWQAQNGILTNSDSTRIAYHLLDKFPQIAKSLILRFNHFIIDEAQDTSETQYAIFDKLIENGLQNIEFVGDPYQSLYEWRDAKPQEFLNRYKSPDWNSYDLSDNWRSTQTIINCYSKLRKPEEENIIARITQNIEPIYILKFENELENQAVEKYNELCKMFSKNQVVVRGTELSTKLSGVKATDNYWKNNAAFKIVQSILAYKNKDIKKAIDTFRWVFIDLKYPTLEYREKKEKYTNIKADYNQNVIIMDLIAELEDFSKTLILWTTESSAIIKSKLGLGYEIDFELKQGTFRKFHQQTMASLFITDKLAWEFPITTIHKVKGMTLDTTLLILNKNSSGKNISINDIQQPSGHLTEKQTLIYVAMSRPRYLLAIGIENTISDKELMAKFGNDIVIK